MVFLAGRTSTLQDAPQLTEARMVLQLRLLPPLLQMSFLTDRVFLTKERRVFPALERRERWTGQNPHNRVI